MKEVLLYGGLAGLSTLLGVLLVMYKRKLAEKYSIYFVSFAAGVLLAVSFFNLIPEGLKLYNNGLVVVLVGLILFYLIESFVTIHVCKEEKCELHKVGWMSFLGLGFHSLIDGVIIGVSFNINVMLGLITTIAIISHEFPEGLISASLMFRSKFKKEKVFWYSLLVALATPVGAVLAYLFLGNVGSNVLGILLSLAAGSFLYVAMANLIPELHSNTNKMNFIIMLLGILFVYLLGLVF
ncbi:hypothetical protein CL618_01215 [archaeon]|nr:hypothetical protein [archaeon]|tara:strand:+ start:21 stop:734 length:714 start_codon:yes stop_codon:yes gene_type:complete